jgi:tetratricopeptide (TPR) repeat protein
MNGQKLHEQAINAREHEQDFEKALKHTDEAIIAYSQENDSTGLVEVYGTRQNTLDHLAEQNGNKDCLILAKYAAMAAVEIAEERSLPAAMPYRDLGKAYEKLKDYQNAASYYEKSLNSALDGGNNRESVRADIKAHFAYSKYKSGDKSGLDLMSEAISELEEAGEQKYEKDVWLSGAHMRAADMLQKDNPELARQHLQKAKEIIDKNEELVLRKTQWEKLNSKLSE